MDSDQIDGSSTQAAAGQDTRNSNTDMPPGEIEPDLWNETQEFLQSRFVEKLNLLYFLPRNEVGVSVRRRITAGVDGGHFTIGVQ